ncbi:hypothetical protein J437_LFUL005127 [Ladona fulva]|uniref:Uncharacterized protein n=1 Tax=Ladona fulva TaxID=123851 RepID=A0A8K0KG96_LADFU|nr:hypothetical protein J437_LFUL005127 [Ladona fulva]
MKGAWGKRSWDNFRGSWGKRSPTEWGGGGGYVDGYPEEDDSMDLGPNGIAYDDGPQREGPDYGPEAYEGKRSWGNLKGAWGKRGYASDEDGLDEMEAELAEHYGDADKRAWRNFKGSWGKRDPGWHNLKGLWGKRAGSGKWNKLTSVWGKRSVGGETGLKTMDAPSGV